MVLKKCHMSESLQEMPVDRDDFHRMLSRAFMRGQWQNETARVSHETGIPEVETGLVGPNAGGEPFLWQWPTVRSFLETSCAVVPEAFTARRALMFNNPGLPKGTTTTINMGIQMIRPGELAWAHRHSISALRFVIEGNPSLCTVVNGERCAMANYDLVLTPAWSWHDHHNGHGGPGIWLDVLDGPVVRMLNQLFFENFGPAQQPLANFPGETLTVLKAPDQVLPSASSGFGAQMHFPWQEVEPRLHKAAGEQGSLYDGVVLEYVDPKTGGSVLPAFGCWAQMLRPGEATKSHRHTSSAVYFVIGGEGRTIVGDRTLEWGPHDCFAVPNWSWHEHLNRSRDKPALLFSVNDIPLIRYLGLYREEPEISISHAGRAPGDDASFLRMP